jgi:hypothetical protein
MAAGYPQPNGLSLGTTSESAAGEDSATSGMDLIGRLSNFDVRATIHELHERSA